MVGLVIKGSREQRLRYVSRARSTGFKAQVCHLLAVLPWSIHLPLLCLSFLTSKVGIVILCEN